MTSKSWSLAASLSCSSWMALPACGGCSRVKQTSSSSQADQQQERSSRSGARFGQEIGACEYIDFSALFWRLEIPRPRFAAVQQAASCQTKQEQGG